MVKTIVFLILSTAARAGILCRDENGYVVPAMMPDNDPRMVVTLAADESVMPPYVDDRGCYRWQMSAGKIVFVALKDRRVPAARVLEVWTPLAQWRALGLDAALGDVTLKTAYDAKLAQLQAEYDRVTRAGVASDDPPQAPSKTTITPK